MPDHRGRAQAIVVRGDKILMVQHNHDGITWYCLPGGGIEPGETPEAAALRELRQECCVSGTIIKKTGEWVDPYDSGKSFPTFHVDIGGQTPSLGTDPEMSEYQVLAEVRWMALNEMCERDRAHLWAAGLLSVERFWMELATWGDEVNYPTTNK